MDGLLILSVLPVIYLCKYIYDKDTHPEPFKKLRKMFLFGFLSIIPIIILETLLSKFFSYNDSTLSFINLFINIFIVVAISEEGFKWLVTYYVGIKDKECDEIYDSIVYAVFASLGFACIENVLYVINGGFNTAIMRAIFTIPGHACFGVLMGYFIAKSKLNKNSTSLNLFLSFVIPALFHTIYDTLLFKQEVWSLIVFLVFDLAMVIYCFLIVKKLSKLQSNYAANVSKNQNITYNINFCPKCGQNIQNCNYCPKCGFKK